ncbi:hypothetical protein BC831DRAFT_457813 [Entophlyctis helioformis]|nr:hypothetical protein BC831DRAFT_457813 [Entophlyctis helioformis]
MLCCAVLCLVLCLVLCQSNAPLAPSNFASCSLCLRPSLASCSSTHSHRLVSLSLALFVSLLASRSLGLALRLIPSTCHSAVASSVYRPSPTRPSMDSSSLTPACIDSGAAVTPLPFHPAAKASYSATHAPSILVAAQAGLPIHLQTAAPPLPLSDSHVHTLSHQQLHQHQQQILIQQQQQQQQQQQILFQHQQQQPIQQQQQPEALSYQASEFIAFAVHKLWHRPALKRSRTVPNRPANASHVPSSPPPQATSDPDSAQDHRPDSPTAPDQAGPRPVAAPFNAVVCPPGTSAWYPAFFEAVHTVLSRSGCSLPHILIALLYVARLRQLLPEDMSGQGSEYRVFVSSLILAQKFHSDDRYSNKAWSKITKLPLPEINTMEREFLTSIGGRLHVRDSEYAKWRDTIQALGQEHAVTLHAAALRAQERVNDALLARRFQDNADDVFAAGRSDMRRFLTMPRQPGNP